MEKLYIVSCNRNNAIETLFTITKNIHIAHRSIVYHLDRISTKDAKLLLLDIANGQIVDNCIVDLDNFSPGLSIQLMSVPINEVLSTR